MTTKSFSPDEIHHDAVNKSVLAQLIGGDGFDDVTHEEFSEFIDTHSQPLMDEDLAELTKSAEEEETEDQEDPSQEDEAEGLTLEWLDEHMRTAKELHKKATSWDPYMVRSVQFSNTIDSSMSTYKTLFTTMKKQ